MNIGQLIGELQLKAEGILPGLVAPGPRSRTRGVRMPQALAIAQAEGIIGRRHLSERLGISLENADNLLFRMAKEGKLEKVSAGKYRVPQ